MRSVGVGGPVGFIGRGGGSGFVCSCSVFNFSAAGLFKAPGWEGSEWPVVRIPFELLGFRGTVLEGIQKPAAVVDPVPMFKKKILKT